MLENESGDIVVVENSNEVAPVVEQEAPESEVTNEQEEKQEAEGEVKRKRPTSGFVRKLNKLEQQLAEKDARLAELEKKLTKPQGSDKPNIDNFDSFEAYNEALLDWKVDQRDVERERRTQEREQQKEIKAKQSEALSSWEKKEESLGDDLEEYEELVAQHQNTSFRNELIQATFESDLGPQIRHFLLKNPDELAKINKAELSSFAIFKKISELESKFSKPPVNKVSKSSEPITPLKGTSKTGVKLENINDADQWIAHRYPHLYGKK